MLLNWTLSRVSLISRETIKFGRAWTDDVRMMGGLYFYFSSFLSFFDIAIAATTSRD